MPDQDDKEPATSVPESSLASLSAAEREERRKAEEELTTIMRWGLARYRETVEKGRPLIHEEDEPDRQLRDRVFGGFVGVVLDIVRSELARYPTGARDDYSAAAETALGCAYTLLDHAHVLTEDPYDEWWEPGQRDDTLVRIEKAHHLLHDAQLLRSDLQVAALKTLDRYRPSLHEKEHNDGLREILEEVLKARPDLSRQYVAQKLAEQKYVPFQAGWLAGDAQARGWFAGTFEEYVGACVVSDLRALTVRSQTAERTSPPRTAEHERPIYRLAYQAIYSWDRSRGRPRREAAPLPPRFEAANALLSALGIGAASADALERTWNARKKGRDSDSGF